MLLFGVSRPGGAILRPEPCCVGVLALDRGVFERVVGVVALESLPFVCDTLVIDGEFERVDGGLEESLELLIFLTRRGSFEADDG